MQFNGETASGSRLKDTLSTDRRRKDMRMESARKGLQGYSNVLRLRLKKTQASPDHTIPYQTRPEQSKTKHETQQHRKNCCRFPFPSWRVHISHIFCRLSFSAPAFSPFPPFTNIRVVNFAKNIFSNNPNKQMAACKKYKSRPPHKSRAKKSAKPTRTCVSVCFSMGERILKKYIINVNKLSDYSVGAVFIYVFL